VHEHSCGCGFADPDRLKKLSEKKKDEMPLEERNKKKLAAVEATREHGNILFKEGKYEQAFAVYDRGILIINGSYGMSDEEQAKLTQLELTLDLNMAACQLKLKNYLKAIDHCKMALQIESQHPKAFFRIGQAHLGMGNLAEATQNFKTVLELDPRNAEAVKQLEEIRRLEAQQRDTEKQFAKSMAARMAGHREAPTQTSCNDCTSCASSPSPSSFVCSPAGSVDQAAHCCEHEPQPLKPLSHHSCCCDH